MDRKTRRDENGIAMVDYGETLFDALQVLAHYEDLAEQGRLAELPCKAYETVWLIRQGKVEKGFVNSVTGKYKKSFEVWLNISYSCDSAHGNFRISCEGNFCSTALGKTVFLSRPAAEEGLRGEGVKA